MNRYGHSRRRVKRIGGSRNFCSSPQKDFCNSIGPKHTVAAAGKAIFSQPEVAIGLVLGGGSTQRLPGLIGRGRALEVLLGCNDLSAELAERYGYINRALPADDLTPFVEKLARRIASFPAHTIAHAKTAVDRGAFGSMAEGLLVEAHESDLSVASEVTQARVTEASRLGAETYEEELELNFLSRLSPTG